MHLGVLEIELLLDESFSLKDKRRVVKSLKDRLHREHLVSVAEVAGQDHQRFGVLGVTFVSADPERVSAVLDAVERKIDGGTEYRTGGRRRSVLSADSFFTGQLSEGEPAWTDEDAAVFEELGRRAVEEAGR